MTQFSLLYSASHPPWQRMSCLFSRHPIVIRPGREQPAKAFFPRPAFNRGLVSATLSDLLFLLLSSREARRSALI